eukprot:1715309-Rhodomonas_salina.1
MARVVDLVPSNVVDLSNDIERCVGSPSTDVDPDGPVTRSARPRRIHTERVDEAAFASALVPNQNQLDEIASGTRQRSREAVSSSDQPSTSSSSVRQVWASTT